MIKYVNYAIQHKYLNFNAEHLYMDAVMSLLEAPCLIEAPPKSVCKLSQNSE